MESIFSAVKIEDYSFSEKKKDKSLPEIQEIIKQFVDKINTDRKEHGYKPYPESFIASRMYLAGYKTKSQMKMLHGSCNDSVNFGAFWHIKTKKKV